jgi:hypothetical protein
MKQSNYFSLNWRDALRGLVVAILTPIIVIAQQSLESGVLTINWKTLVTAGIAGGLAYLVKNLLTKPDTIQSLTSEEDKEIIGGRPNDR